MSVYFLVTSRWRPRTVIQWPNFIIKQLSNLAFPVLWSRNAVNYLHDLEMVLNSNTEWYTCLKVVAWQWKVKKQKVFSSATVHGRNKMPHTKVDSEEIRILPPHYLHELPQEDEERLAKIFSKLDSDGNGTIDIHDLSSSLKSFGVPHRYAEVLILLFIVLKIG